ncbi:MAG: 30S ribosome-binding factor RbfA [Coriobacteriia bacterium]|nr:30S ribosome-binding factor RbfA [Coriobacteriia bacterium]
MRKVNETVKEALADTLVDEVSDPRVELVTVTGVEVSPDLRHATVFVIAHGDEERYQAALEGLRSASGRIRSGLGRRVRMKYLPELQFRIDQSVDEGMRIAEALKHAPPRAEEPDEEAE